MSHLKRNYSGLLPFCFLEAISPLYNKPVMRLLIPAPGSKDRDQDPHQNYPGVLNFNNIADFDGIEEC